MLNESSTKCRATKWKRSNLNGMFQHKFSIEHWFLAFWDAIWIENRIPKKLWSLYVCYECQPQWSNKLYQKHRKKKLLASKDYSRRIGKVLMLMGVFSRLQLVWCWCWWGISRLQLEWYWWEVPRHIWGSSTHIMSTLTTKLVWTTLSFHPH